MDKAEEARRRLRTLMDNASQTCKQIANQYNYQEYAGRPYDAVKLFYPRLSDIQENGGMYSSRCTGENVPELKQELLLGMPVLVDLDEPKSKSFSDEYGMDVAQFVNEINEERIIPILNQKDPNASFSDNYIEYILPILNTTNIQIAHIRTVYFENWINGGEALEDIEDIEEQMRSNQAEVDIVKEYFNYRKDSDEEESLRQTLRTQNVTAIPNIIAGRWRNIVSLYPKLEQPLLTVFDDLRDSPFSAKAAIINGVKNIVCSPITAGRGGIFRAGQSHIDEIRGLRRHSQLSKKLSTLVHSDIGSDFWISDTIDTLERQFAIPTPERMDYNEYKRLVESPYAQTLREGCARFFQALRQPPADVINFNPEETWAGILKDYSDRMRQYKRLNGKQTKDLTTWAGIFGLIPGIGQAFSIAAIIVDLIQRGHARYPSIKPGYMLAQLVWEARSELLD